MAWDHTSGIGATADALGLVAITMTGDRNPARLLQHEAGVNRALALNKGGSLLAVGDDSGTVAVYRTADGQPVFFDHREGPAGEARAMRAMAFSPDGRRFASLSVDGRLRITDLETMDRVGTFPDFSGHTLEWDLTGTRVVAVDRLRQPVMLSLSNQQRIAFPLVPGGTQVARFTHDGDHIVALGPGGLTLVDIRQMAVIENRAADRSSGMLELLRDPNGNRFAVISARSVHFFDLPDLRHVGKHRHGARSPTGVARWDEQGIAVADNDGRVYRPGRPGSLAPTVCTSGVGPWRLAGHENTVAVWKEHRRLRTFVPEVSTHDPATGRPQIRPMTPDERIIEVRNDREGKLLALLPESSPVNVYEGSSGKLLFQAGEDTVDTPRLDIALGVIGCLLERGGLRWFDLRNNRTFELEWVQDFSITGGGTWIAVLTPKGLVHILDPSTGEDALPAPEPLGDAPVRLISFVQRHPELLVLDEDGVLGLYDLTPAARDGTEAEPYRICRFFDADIDQLWGLEDHRHAAVRIQEPDDGTATMVFVDLDDGKVVEEVRGLLPYATVDPVHGRILEPGIGSAVLERDMQGHEVRVLRSLPHDQWVTFYAQGVLGSSQGAREWVDFTRSRQR
jgi:WD40 repeat protein